MTQFTILWDADLERHFIDAWVDSNSETRAMLTEIANWVDAYLEFDPHMKGQETADSVRILTIPIHAARVSIVNRSASS